jgi:hypothetical protein
LQGLNPFVRRLIAIVLRLLIDKFSREFDGLKATKVRFEGDKPLDSLEN